MPRFSRQLTHDALLRGAFYRGRTLRRSKLCRCADRALEPPAELRCERFRDEATYERESHLEVGPPNDPRPLGAEGLELDASHPMLDWERSNSSDSVGESTWGIELDNLLMEDRRANPDTS